MAESLATAAPPVALPRFESRRRSDDGRVWGSGGLQGYEQHRLLTRPASFCFHLHGARFPGRHLAAHSLLPARRTGISATFERFATARPGPSGHARRGNTWTKSRLVGLPPPPAVLTWHSALTAPREPSATFLQGRSNTSASDRNHPLDLHATFPTLSGPSVPMSMTSEILSWGFPKISPPSYAIVESTPGSWVSPPACLRVVAARRRPRSVLVVSHHPDGLLLRDRAGLLRPAADHGVHRVSACCEQVFPRCVSALQSFAPRSWRRREGGFPSSHRGVRHCSASCLHAASRSPVSLALPPLLPVIRVGCHQPPPMPTSSTSRLCSTLGAVPRDNVAAAAKPMLSWACSSLGARRLVSPPCVPPACR